MSALLFVLWTRIMGLEQIDAEVRAYTPDEECCAPWNDGWTATGVEAARPGVAVPRHGPVPMGALVCVPGYLVDNRWAIADDTGGRLNEWDGCGPVPIEVRFQSREEALQWGVKRLSIYYVSAPFADRKPRE